MILDPEDRDDLWMYMYFAAGIVSFVIIVIILSVVSMRGCKGESRDTPDLRCQPSHDALTTTTIYKSVK
ncbi:hypothetical protein PFLUV_G00273400 [Perca fluviatilis]|uniref:Uncharacterized protein n=1 Tax=Perca fluviatilis TaxID=8168 RepID=A0A6A5DTV5_PERFL|nr:hypothetical protein PFLUV_G00273400 [Perca fluviatilis]